MNVSKISNPCSFVAVIALPVVLLSLWQFLAAVLAVFNGHYSFIVGASLTLAVMISLPIARHLSCSGYNLKIRHYLGFFSAAIFTTALFVFVYKLQIFDAFWPTTVIGLVNQVTRGHFPVSYLSYPEFWANYHQGFIFISGQLARVTDLNAAQSIQLLTCVLFFYFVFFLEVMTAKFTSPVWAYVAVVLLLLARSAQSPLTLFEPYHANLAISVVEYFNSNSWPLSLCILLMIMMMPKALSEYSPPRYFSQYILLFTLATSNAALFAVGRLSFCMLSLMIILASKQVTWRHKWALLGIPSLLVLWVFPMFLPSAFLRGDQYEAPAIALQFWGQHHEMIMPYYLYLLKHVLLAGPVAVVVLCGVCRALLARDAVSFRQSPLVIFLGMTMGISFIFPLVFSFTNINWWDNLHKFTLIWMVSALMIAAIYTPQFWSWLSGRRSKVFQTGFVLMILVLVLPQAAPFSLQSFFSMRKDGVDVKEPYAASDVAYSDVVQFLSSQTRTPLIYPYGQEFYHYSPALFIASFSGSFIRNCFYTNFLLSSQVKQSYTDNMEWWQPDKIMMVVNEPYQPTWILLKKAQLSALKGNIKDFNHSKYAQKKRILISDMKTFREYLLVRLV